MTHRNARLTVYGRLLLIHRLQQGYTQAARRPPQAPPAPPLRSGKGAFVWKVSRACMTGPAAPTPAGTRCRSRSAKPSSGCDELGCGPHRIAWELGRGSHFTPWRSFIVIVVPSGLTAYDSARSPSTL